MPVPQRLPFVNGDDGQWGDILVQWLKKEHYDDGTDNAVNGGHQKVTLRAGSATAGTAPLKFTSGTLLTTPEAGAIEFLTDRLYFTGTTGPTRRTIAAYDDNSGATGDIYYRDSSGIFTRLGIGSSTNVLTVSSGLPSWQPVSTGDVSSNTSSSVDSEIALFSGTAGKTIKRATGSGIAKITSGVLGTGTAGTDYTSPSSTETFTNKTYDTAGTGNVFKINTVTISDITGTGKNVLDSSPTIVTPTIASFTNAQHDHSNAAGGGTVAHSSLSGLTSGDPHTQYALLAGRSGGQTLIGDTASAGNLTLQSTAHATFGKVIAADPVGLMAADRTYTAAPTALVSVSSARTQTMNYATALAPTTLLDASTKVFSTSSGATPWFFARSTATVKNDPAGASNLSIFAGPFIFADNTTIQADSQSITAGAVRSFSAAPTFSILTGGSFTTTTWAGFVAGVTVGSSATLGSTTGLAVNNPTNSGTITTNTGVDVSAMTAGGTTNIGVKIGTASGGATANYTLWVAGNSNPTGEAGGIVFGSSHDTNLYRSNANELTTDDAFVTGGAITASGLISTTGSNAITAGGAITAGSTLNLFAGTASAAPLLFASGTNLTTAAAGANEYDGAQFYATVDTTSGRGAIPVEQYFRLAADGGTISTIANFFGSTSNISLVANAYYEIEIFCWFLNTTAGTVTWTFTNSAAPTNQNIHYRYSPTTGVNTGAGAATYLEGDIVKDATAALALTVSGTLTTAVDHYAHFKIHLRNGTGTSLKIQATKAVGGTITPRYGSYWKARRLPASSTGTFAA